MVDRTYFHEFSRTEIAALSFYIFVHFSVFEIDLRFNRSMFNVGIFVFIKLFGLFARKCSNYCSFLHNCLI